MSSENSSPVTRTQGAKVPQLLRQRVEQLRNTGHAGYLIHPHRALLTLPMHTRELLPAAVLALLLSLLWCLGTPWILASWHWVLDSYIDIFNLKADTAIFRIVLGGFNIDVPFLNLAAGAPDGLDWSAGLVLSLAALIGSFFLPDWATPLKYFVRVVVVIQLVSQTYFVVMPAAFPYGLGGYHAVMMTAGLVLISMVPILFGLTYYIFDAPLYMKLGMTLMTMTHLWLLVPLQYLLHALIIHQGSLLYMPALFFFFGLALDVFVIVAFYAWAMSWEGKLHPHESEFVTISNRPGQAG